MARPRLPFTPLSDRQRGVLAIVVGTTLLLSPLYLTGLHLGGTAYTYRTAPVHAADGDIVVEGIEERDWVRDRIAGIDCTGSGYDESRACALDQWILESGAVEAEKGYEGGPDYVAFEAGFYRRVVRADGGRTATLDLERVTAREALDGAAVPESSLTWPGRVALLTGGVTTTYPLTHAGTVVETEDGYRLIYLASFHETGSGGQSVLYLVGMAIGLVLVVSGYWRLPSGGSTEREGPDGDTARRDTG